MFVTRRVIVTKNQQIVLLSHVVCSWSEKFISVTYIHSSSREIHNPEPGYIPHPPIVTFCPSSALIFSLKL
jgi:hypothetical protein